MNCNSTERHPKVLGRLGLVLLLGVGMGVAAERERVVVQEATPRPVVASHGPLSNQNVSTLSVVSAGSYSSGDVAPGELVSIFGPNIGPPMSSGARLDSGGALARNLGGVEVRFGDEPAPLLFVSSGQINVQVPYSVASSATAPVSVYLDGRLTGLGSVEVAATNLDLFFFDPLSRHAATVNQDGSLNSPANPAQPGEVITLFGSGHGQTIPEAVTGSLAQPPLASLQNPIKATYWNGLAIGDLDVLYAGPAPGFAGLFQLNLRLPTNLRNVYGALHVYPESPSTNDRTRGVVAVNSYDDRDVREADYYVANATMNPAQAAPGETIEVTFRVANMGGTATRSFDTWVDFDQGGRVVPSLLCTFRSGLGSRASGECLASIVVPNSLSAGPYSLRVWANPFTRANPVWAPELNTDNNQLFVGGTISTSPSGTDQWRGILRFEGQMTLNGRTAPATVDILDGVLSGQAVSLDSSNVLSFFFTDDGPPNASGTTISYPVRSDSLLFGNSVFGSGKGTFSLTMERRETGSPATGEISLTYQGGAKFSGRFTGKLVEAGE